MSNKIYILFVIIIIIIVLIIIMMIKKAWFVTNYFCSVPRTSLKQSCGPICLYSYHL